MWLMEGKTGTKDILLNYKCMVVLAYKCRLLYFSNQEEKVKGKITWNNQVVKKRSWKKVNVEVKAKVKAEVQAVVKGQAKGQVKEESKISKEPQKLLV